VLKSPSWLSDYWLWIAQWPYKIYGISLYSDYESFLLKYADLYPPFVRDKVYRDKTVLWQFTCKGDAQRYCANKYTGDPTYPGGIKDCDLNVTLIDKAAFLDLIGSPIVPAPTLAEIVANHELRITALEQV